MQDVSIRSSLSHKMNKLTSESSSSLGLTPTFDIWNFFQIARTFYSEILPPSRSVHS